MLGAAQKIYYLAWPFALTGEATVISGRIIIWAVDPYANNQANPSPIVPLLAALTSPGDALILPVAVIAPTGSLATVPPFGVAIPGELRLLLMRRLEVYLSSTGLRGISAPAWLDEERNTVASRVDSLLHYARNAGASLIAVTTHGRKGVERALMGSFAETLLLRSDIPTLSVGPHSKRVDEIEEIFFATDFSEIAHNALMKVLPLVRLCGAKLVLFHYFDRCSSAYFPLDPGPKYLVAMEERERWEQEQGRVLVMELRASGINAELLVVRENASVASAILHFSENMRPGIIAMASQTGRVGAVFLGSVTRQIVRSAPCPVWVIHPDRTEEARHKSHGGDHATATR